MTLIGKREPVLYLKCAKCFNWQYVIFKNTLIQASIDAYRTHKEQCSERVNEKTET